MSSESPWLEVDEDGSRVSATIASVQGIIIFMTVAGCRYRRPGASMTDRWERETKAERTKVCSS